MSYVYTIIKVSMSDDPSHELNTWGREGFHLIAYIVIDDELILILENEVPFSGVMAEAIERGRKDKPSEDSHPTMLFRPEDSM